LYVCLHMRGPWSAVCGMRVLDMHDSCDGLQVHLQSSNAHIGETLRTLQGQLSAWLGEVDQIMQATQALAASQQTKVTADRRYTVRAYSSS
jgi:hypothetical protein